MTTQKPLDSGELLWRRVHRKHLVRGEEVSSVEFSGEELSVDIARIQKDMSVTLKDGVGVAEFKAGSAQELGLQTIADPLPDNPAHALVIGKKTKSIKRKLRNASKFVPGKEIIDVDN